MSNNDSVVSRSLPLESIPVLGLDATLKNALDKMTQFRLGIALFVNDSNQLHGILTDGDLRRLLLIHQSPLPALLVTPALEFGTKNPISIATNTTIADAVELMNERAIWDLPIVDENKKLIGLVHRHGLN
jgi:arabinose-5-phosphate isomerase